MSAVDPRDLLAELVDAQEEGVPAIVEVHSHAQQDAVAALLAAECEVYDLRPAVTASPEECLTLLDTHETPDALVLIGCPRLLDVARWATILEARRERLPARVALLIIVLVRDDLPALARGAPGFMSWARGNVVTAADTSASPVDEATLARLRDSGAAGRDVWSETTLSNLRATVGHGGTAS